MGVLTVEGRQDADRRLCSLEQPAAGWRAITVVVDSGAEETVAPPGLFPGQAETSPMQRVGGRYRAANGARIPNVGQLLAGFRTPEGHDCSIRFQLAGVERPLISVSQLARTGHRVEFGAQDGQIIHVQSGRRIQLQRDGGVYLLKMLVRDVAGSADPPADAGGLARGASGFSQPRP